MTHTHTDTSIAMKRSVETKQCKPHFGDKRKATLRRGAQGIGRRTRLDVVAFIALGQHGYERQVKLGAWCLGV